MCSGLCLNDLFNSIFSSSAQHTVLLGQATDAVVGLAHHADGSAYGLHLEGAVHGAIVRVRIDQIQLHGSMIQSVYDAVAGQALAGQIRINNLSIVVFHFVWVFGIIWWANRPSTKFIDPTICDKSVFKVFCEVLDSALFF